MGEAYIKVHIDTTEAQGQLEGVGTQVPQRQPGTASRAVDLAETAVMSGAIAKSVSDSEFQKFINESPTFAKMRKEMEAKTGKPYGEIEASAEKMGQAASDNDPTLPTPLYPRATVAMPTGRDSKPDKSAGGAKLNKVNPAEMAGGFIKGKLVGQASKLVGFNVGAVLSGGTLVGAYKAAFDAVMDAPRHILEDVATYSLFAVNAAYGHRRSAPSDPNVPGVATMRRFIETRGGMLDSKNAWVRALASPMDHVAALKVSYAAMKPLVGLANSTESSVEGVISHGATMVSSFARLQQISKFEAESADRKRERNAAAAFGWLWRAK